MVELKLRRGIGKQLDTQYPRAENVMIRDYSIIILFVDMATRERKYARTQAQEMLIWISECHVGLELYFYFCSLALNLLPDILLFSHFIQML